MTSPFDIEEIFPQDAVGAVRLPRRQSGNAPQGLAVTLLADYTLRTRAWLPSAAITALLGEAGVSLGGARTAISRLTRRGVLESSRQGRNSSHRLTQPAAAHLSTGGSWIVSSASAPRPWEGWWTLIAFSLPQEENTQRRALRGQLRWLGYAPLFDGLWVSPDEFTEQARAQLAQVNLGAMTVFRARHVEFAAASGRNPVEAWDIPAIAAEYESFVGRWSMLLPRIRGGRVPGAEAVRARTEVMDTYRRFPTLDPQLPLQLLPSGWLRRRALEVFAAVYDGLAAAAEEHVQAVVARHADGARLGISAHTVADMLAGVRHGPSADVPAPLRRQ
ncbi:PaaX family transcriptional regulator [Catellatospora sichuanensis]|uniref:PaaX family transcriptional regulator n=1 Tax=Catellatospora sichuanensis TaxID=1969805 RepID=UPI0011821D50|nr:PaaX family transcriptional regulator C-terminal domain-containing protein [Catellatospora sichuanensis]